MAPPVGATSAARSTAPRRVLVVAGAFVVCTLLAAWTSPVGDGRRPWITVAYVPYWDQTDGFAEVHAHAGTFAQVSPWWFTFDESGQVIPQDDAVLVDLEGADGLRRSGVAVIPTIANHADGVWVPERTSGLLADPDRRTAHVGHIVDLVLASGFDGIDIDYEDLSAGDRAGFSLFVAELGQALREDHKILSVTVHPKPSDSGYDERNLAQDYAAIGAAADQVRVMAYDWHAASSGPGPIAPRDWVSSVASYAATQISPAKIILGVPLYAYDWAPNADAVALTVPEAQALAAEHGATIQRDPANGSAFFAYEIGGQRHEVWIEDAIAAHGKVTLAANAKLGGVFLWRLGDVERALWDLLPRLVAPIS